LENRVYLIVDALRENNLPHFTGIPIVAGLKSWLVTHVTDTKTQNIGNIGIGLGIGKGTRHYALVFIISPASAQ
jgi:hypothetical protein